MFFHGPRIRDMAIYSQFSHEKWELFIAMLNYPPPALVGLYPMCVADEVGCSRSYPAFAGKPIFAG